MATNRNSIARLEIEHLAAEAVRVIAQAAELAAKVVAQASESAAKVVANAASESVKVVDAKASGDHELLVILGLKMDNVEKSIKELKGETVATVSDHERRISFLEQSKTRQNVLMSIGIAILTILVSIMTYHIMK